MGVDETALFRGNFSQEPESKPSVAIHFQVKATRNPKTATKNGEEYWVLYVDVDSKPSGDVVFSIFDDEKNYEGEAELDVDDFRLAYEAYYDDALIAFKGRVVKGNGRARFFETKDLRRVET